MGETCVRFGFIVFISGETAAIVPVFFFHPVINYGGLCVDFRSDLFRPVRSCSSSSC